MNTTLAKINNVSIQLVTDEKSQQLVPIRPICDALGIHYSSQLKKLKEDDFLNSTVVLSTTVGSNGKDREMVCLPLEFVFGWLFTINPKNVNLEAKEAVAKYRIECYRALYKHFAAQSQFLQDKQVRISKEIDAYETMRLEFKTAEKRLKEAKALLFRAKDDTFEEWEFNNRQMVLFPAEDGGSENGQ
jgi:hypothetical protein